MRDRTRSAVSTRAGSQLALLSLVAALGIAFVLTTPTPSPGLATATRSSPARPNDAPASEPPGATPIPDPLAGVAIRFVGDVRTASQPDQIALIALDHLARVTRTPANADRAGAPFKLVSLTAVRGSQINVVELAVGAPDPLSVDDSVVWVVRATGPFVGLRVPPGKDAIRGDSGYLVVDDPTGQILQMGIP